jgi:hypothetical protein
MLTSSRDVRTQLTKPSTRFSWLCDILAACKQVVHKSSSEHSCTIRIDSRVRAGNFDTNLDLQESASHTCATLANILDLATSFRVEFTSFAARVGLLSSSQGKHDHRRRQWLNLIPVHSILRSRGWCIHAGRNCERDFKSNKDERRRIEAERTIGELL